MTPSPEDVFADLYASHHGQVSSRARRMTYGDQHLAEDVTAETFARAWRHISRHGDSGPGSDIGWLSRICTNIVISHYRRHSVRRETATAFADEGIDVPDPVTTEDVVEARERVRVLRQAVSELPEPQREVVERVAFDEESQTEVARSLGVQQAAVSRRMTRARAALGQSVPVRRLVATG